jgi:ubiquinone/menaquinone biosynthesis C-methylase UbiE
MTPGQRLAYDLSQGGRVAWFLGHALAAERLATPVLDRLPEGLPDRRTFLAELGRLLQRDRANIAAGRYRMPADLWPDPAAAWRQSRSFLADLGRINLRRQRRDHQEVRRSAPADRRYPRYYVQNFHYQTDGYLSPESARLYDFQVEVLFNGGADAMRRQALLPIGDHLRGRRLAGERLLDVACGTGRLLAMIKHNWPRLPVVGLDLSTAYLAVAKAGLVPWSWARLVVGAAERLPFPDASFSLVTSSYLFHELPAAVRARAAQEMARVLQPGGRLVFVDSLQRGDFRPFDGLLELFPQLYHEPYYRAYTRADLGQLFRAAGLHPWSADRAYLSKVLVFIKGDQTTASDGIILRNGSTLSQ